MNSAEAVQASTITAFCDRFRPHGFRAEAMMPVYGLAENSVGASFPRYGSRPIVDFVDRRALEQGAAASTSATSSGSVRAMVSVGRALPGHKLRIVGVNDEALEDRQVGSVELWGPSTMRGYHRHPEETARAIRADGWLRTGDLGYIADGELYVVGRSKEVVKKAGAKYDAADIQAVVGEVPGVRSGCVAAFSVPNEGTGTEDLVIVAEVSKGLSEYDTVTSGIRHIVQSTFGTRPDNVRLIVPGTLPKSTSGKIKGLECRRRYLNNDLQLAGPAETGQ
jgi:acyl-CoA synthetase (AMP-forming)/AMP-acid ligase II